MRPQALLYTAHRARLKIFVGATQQPSCALRRQQPFASTVTAAAPRKGPHPISIAIVGATAAIIVGRYQIDKEHKKTQKPYEIKSCEYQPNPSIVTLHSSVGFLGALQSLRCFYASFTVLNISANDIVTFFQMAALI
jgi:hypothetical protein